MKEPVKRTLKSPILWLGLAILTLYGKILFGEILFQKDVFAYQLPEKFLIRNSLSSGEIPLLNPYIACGSSFLGNIDTGVLNPLNFLLLFGDSIFGFHLFVFVHLLLAALAMYFLLRRAFNLDSWVSALGGLSYTFGYVWSSVPFGSYRCAYLVPLFFIFYLRFLNSHNENGVEKVSDVFFPSLCLGLLLLCGNFQEAYMAILFAVIFLLSKLFADRKQEIPASTCRFSGPVIIIFSGILLSAPGILPAYLCSIESYRNSGISLLESQQWSFPPQRIAEYFSPFLFGARQGNASFSQIHHWKVRPFHNSLHCNNIRNISILEPTDKMDYP